MTDAIFQQRRQRLFDIIGDTMLVLPGHTEMQESADAVYPFHQETTFLWATGLTVPDAVLILNGQKNTATLLIRQIETITAVFDGEWSDAEMTAISGIDSITRVSSLEEAVRKQVKAAATVAMIQPEPVHPAHTFARNPLPQSLYETVVSVTEVTSVRQPVMALRGRKDVAEIALMRTAADMTIEGFRRVKALLPTLTQEYEIEATLSHAFRFAGAVGHAYSPIVAGGANALILHYRANSAPLPKNGLVLIDAAANYAGYCADVTRTYATGTPTARQKAVHAAVENAHHQIIALLSPGKSVKAYHEEVDSMMIEALKSLGLYKKPEDYRKYFPHAISHGLGLDPHDPLGGPETFQPGMVLTVEPGIYIPEEGIGVRIEDDILITDTGFENLTGALSTSL